jgi:hypothetical protein
MKTKTIIDFFRILILSLILSATIGYSLADWAPPTSAPPFNNTPPPINVGPASQTRDGNLFLNQRVFANKGIFGGVTIGGISDPVEKLDVFGNMRATGKIRSASTVSGDIGTTVTTKDYVDAQDVVVRNYADTNDNQTLSLSGKTLGISGGNSVTLPSSGGPFSSCITVGGAAQGAWYSDGAMPTCPAGYTMNGIQTWGGCSGGVCGSNIVCCI